VRQPLGAILAGGLGRRLGSEKATVLLDGRPLIYYPLDALAAVLRDVVVLAKADTPLPSLPGATIWIEPDLRRHPLVGIVQALELAGARSVLVCAADLPFVSADLVRCLAEADPQGAPAVLAAERGQSQPLLGCYQPSALALLDHTDERPLRDQVAEISPRLLEVDDPEQLFNVNNPEDLLQATALLDRRRVSRT